MTQLTNLERTELETLRNEVIILQSRLDAILAHVAPTLNLPEEWAIPARCQQVLRALYATEKPISAQYLHDVYLTSPMEAGRDINFFQTWESHVSKLRKKINALQLPIEIKSERFIGYWLTPDSKVYLKQFLVNTEVANV